MTINDVISFSQKENIFLEENEYLKIYDFIKNNWDKLIKDENLVKNYLNQNFDYEKSKKIYEVYLKYQKKYRSYL